MNNFVPISRRAGDNILQRMFSTTNLSTKDKRDYQLGKCVDA